MSLFAKLFKRSQAADLTRGRGWTIDIVGESKFQDNLQFLYRSLGGAEHDVKASAVLHPENSNGYDPNAVRVEIGGRPVGYLTRQMAAEYRGTIGDARGQGAAKIVGGFEMDDGTRAFFGVKLNLSWPPRLRT